MNSVKIMARNGGSSRGFLYSRWALPLFILLFCIFAASWMVLWIGIRALLNGPVSPWLFAACAAGLALPMGAMWKVNRIVGKQAKTEGVRRGVLTLLWYPIMTSWQRNCYYRSSNSWLSFNPFLGCSVPREIRRLKEKSGKDMNGEYVIFENGWKFYMKYAELEKAVEKDFAG